MRRCMVYSWSVRRPREVLFNRVNWLKDSMVRANQWSTVKSCSTIVLGGPTLPLAWLPSSVATHPCERAECCHSVRKSSEPDCEVNHGKRVSTSPRMMPVPASESNIGWTSCAESAGGKVDRHAGDFETDHEVRDLRLAKRARRKGVEATKRLYAHDTYVRLFEVGRHVCGRRCLTRLNEVARWRRSHRASSYATRDPAVCANAILSSIQCPSHSRTSIAVL